MHRMGSGQHTGGADLPARGERADRQIAAGTDGQIRRHAARRDSPYWPRVARRIDHWDEIGRREPSGGSLPAKTWVERPKGIEPSPSVWKTEALPLSYGRALPWDGAQRTG